MIGVFGGTFDPVHNGHRQIARDAREALELSTVLFIPLNRAVHREQPQAGAGQRLAMLQLALSGEAGMAADDRELRRGGSSYMVDTLEELRAEHPAEPLCLLLGGDAFLGFDSWHRPARILRIANIAVLQRPGTPQPGGNSLPEVTRGHIAGSVTDLQQAQHGSVVFVPVTQMDIASSAIRRKVRTGARWQDQVPAAVAAYIEHHSLYRHLV